MYVPILGCFHLKQARMGCIRHQGAALLSEAVWFVSKVWPPSLPIHRIPADLALSVGKGPGSDNLQNLPPSPRIMRRFEKPFSHNSISQFSSPVGLRGIAFISPLGGGRGVAYRDPTPTPMPSGWGDTCREGLPLTRPKPWPSRAW